VTFCLQDHCGMTIQTYTY